MHDNQRSDRRSRSGSRHRRTSRRARLLPHQRASPAAATRKTQLLAEADQTSSPAKENRFSSSAASRTILPIRQADRQPSQNGHRRLNLHRRDRRASRNWSKSVPRRFTWGIFPLTLPEGDLYELFNGVGQVQNAEIVSNKYTQKSKGFAFVTMLTVEEARRAVSRVARQGIHGPEAGGQRREDQRPRECAEAAEPRRRGCAPQCAAITAASRIEKGPPGDWRAFFCRKAKPKRRVPGCFSLWGPRRREERDRGGSRRCGAMRRSWARTHSRCIRAGPPDRQAGGRFAREESGII